VGVLGDDNHDIVSDVADESEKGDNEEGVVHDSVSVLLV